MGARAWRWSGALVLGAWLGCSSDVFLCQDDGGCEQEGEQGVCQPTGYCSFPDESCESGQRYGDLAGGTLARTCVDPETVTGGGGSEAGPGPTSGGTTAASGSPTSTDPDDGTTRAVDESGPPPDPSTTDEPPTATDEGTTGSASVECRFDDFDDGMLDSSWCPAQPSGLAIEESEDVLRIHLIPEEWGGAAGQAADVSTCDARPLLELVATTHVEQVPAVSSYTEAFLEVGNDTLRLGLGVVGDQLYAFVFENGRYSGAAWQPYSPAAHHYWRVLGTPEGLVAEVSPDGVAWSHLHSYFVELAGEVGHVRLGVWSAMVPLGSDSAIYDSLEVCAVGG